MAVLISGWSNSTKYLNTWGTGLMLTLRFPTSIIASIPVFILG